MNLGLLDYITAISWYCAFGIAHECSHLAAAVLLGVKNDLQVTSRWKSLLFDAIVHRQIWIPCAGSEMCSDSGDDWRLRTIRHAGWLSSLAVAILICYYYRNSKEKRLVNNENPFSGSCLCTMAAILTAVDAIATDLLGMGKLQLFPSNAFISIDPAVDSILFHCGNFGVILLSGAWFGKGGKTALDILEKMIQVTMVRGAQSGKLLQLASSSCFVPYHPIRWFAFLHKYV